MTRHFDPRAWNIAASLALVAGCGSRTIGSEGGETSASGTSTTTATTMSGDECVVDSDCPDYYYCYDGFCDYVPHHDGSWNYECFSHEECGLLEVCDFMYCLTLDSPAACPPAGPEQPLLDIPLAGLRLSFANVDDSPQSELVVVTETALEAHASGVDMPTITPHGLDTQTLVDVVAGQLQDEPGEDVALLLGGEVALLGSDGAGGFGPDGPAPLAIDNPGHLLAVELDGQPPEELVGYGIGAGAATGNGPIIWLDEGNIDAATGRDVPSEGEGVSFLVDNSFVRIMRPDGTEQAFVALYGDTSTSLTSLAWTEAPVDVASGAVAGWTAFQAFDSQGSSVETWGVVDVVSATLGADFDGDGVGDLALIIEGEVYIHRNVSGPGGCLESTSLPLPVLSGLRDWDAADFDGDGDDDLALLLVDDRLLVFDAG